MEETCTIHQPTEEQRYQAVVQVLPPEVFACIRPVLAVTEKLFLTSKPEVSLAEYGELTNSLMEVQGHQRGPAHPPPLSTTSPNSADIVVSSLQQLHATVARLQTTLDQLWHHRDTTQLHPNTLPSNTEPDGDAYTSNTSWEPTEQPHSYSTCYSYNIPRQPPLRNAARNVTQ
ncbi:hypothetical protein Pcinc_003525 [Petrolisthes cinctipes]|uniref:Uncharacterized protein n=1 Tax=Petrolisthes cinctipes TaxID=88211 RepID=A0AAE1GIV0_PETCI|nr:hypothetical protein Pcinc_003525 [Petrolisthes cinctipes]